MLTLSERLNGIISQIERSVDLDEVNEIVQTTQRWIMKSKEGGIFTAKSTYLLLPSDINKLLRDELKIDLTSDDVEKFCHLAIEKRDGLPPGVRLVYEFNPRPLRRGGE